MEGERRSEKGEVVERKRSCWMGRDVVVGERRSGREEK